ncbi:MAG TPA: rhodanese-like domain-containing protein [Marmoricola sp.]|nr:rhodanese-like domain-containing protein [Marmoricola sp.]
MHEVPTVSVSDIPDPLPPSATVLDVREPVEWHYGHIDNALHVPLHDLPGRLGDLPASGRLLVVCKMGGRSAQAVAWLQQQGVDAVNVDGGMIEWAAGGRPMVSENGQEPQVV